MPETSKATLAQAVKDACSTPLTNAEADNAVNAVVNGIKMSLQNGVDVRLNGFGTFRLQHRAARTGQNPRTGEPIAIAARNVVKFKASSALL